MRTIPPIPATLLAAAIMIVCWTLGRREGLRAKARGVTSARFHDTSMTLLGVLLAFSFGISLQKFNTRREAVIADANAIRSFTTCAGLLPEPGRGALRAAVRDYLEVRLEMARDRRPEVLRTGLAKSDRLHARMIELVGEAVEARTPMATPLINSLNTLTSSHATRLAAIRDHLPIQIVAVLLVTAAMAMFLQGRNQGIAGDRTDPGLFGYVFVASLLIWVIIDLNDSSAGTVRVSQEPLERLLESLKSSAPAR